MWKQLARRVRRSRSNARPRRTARSAPPSVESLEPIRLLSGDPVLRWNAVALQANAVDHSGGTPSQGGPGASSRALAIVHAAIFDAANAVDRRFEPLLLQGRMPAASLDAAVAQAARATLIALYPSQRDTFVAAFHQDLDQIPDGRAERLGIRVGRAAALRVLLDRANDGSDLAATYTAPNLPGLFQTYPGERSAIGPGWGQVRPFALGTVSDFAVLPPPALDSQAYATSFNDVKALGGDGVNTPTFRTAEQTEIGIYWGYDGVPGLGTPPRLFNQITRVIAEAQGNSTLENARLFALVNIAMADAGIASWDCKYIYDFWRPDRGIRQVDPAGKPMDDGNPLTEADPNWTPLGAPYTNAPPGGANFTPAFPAYVSGHATFGAAVFQTLARFYGRDDIAFTFTSDEYNGLNRDADGSVRPLKPRSFESLSQAAEENARSRIYLGVHWSFDAEQGMALGNDVANEIFENTLNPLPRRGRD